MAQFLKNAVSYLSGNDNDEFVGANIDLETHKLNVKSVIGEGGFGKVYRTVNTQDGSEYALKRLFVPEDSACKIQQEISILRKVSTHPNICTFIKGASHSLPERRGFTEFLILLEYCPGSLANIIKAAGTRLFSSGEVLKLFYGVCQAVRHLHSLTPTVIHRDIKAENVILSSRGMVKLCDFGSVALGSVQPTAEWNGHQRAVLEDEVQCNTTPCFRAPEMVDLYLNHEIGPKSDVWALGCFLYYICFFELPFDDNKLAIVNAKFKPINAHLTMYQPFSPIIRGVFKINPEQRPTAAQILQLLESIASDKDVDPNTPPFENFGSRQVVAIAPQPIPPASNEKRGSWIGYLKGGAENILKEAKSASEKVVGAVVQASNLYSNDRLDEGQLAITAVTSRITAVAFPDPSILEIVEDIVTQRHGKHAYFINLTTIDYPKVAFGGRILNAGWAPLLAPALGSVCHITCVMDRWLLLDPKNVLVVHCQDGTGSTALLLASYFLTCGLYKSANSSLQFYAAARYPNTSGIITASQKRYLEYVEMMVDNSSGTYQPHNSSLILCSMNLSTVPLFSVNRSNCKPFLEIFENGIKILSTLREPDVMRSYGPEDGSVDLAINMAVKGDVRVAVFHARNYIGGKMSAIKMFQFCFNTSFIDPASTSLKLSKSKLDGVVRHENKFIGAFGVSLNICVQSGVEKDEIAYSLTTSSLGIKPPVCCTTPEEYNRIISKVPDKGITISTHRMDEREDVFFEEERSSPNSIEDPLINVTSMNEERPAPMSDPMSRRSPSGPIPSKQGPLFDFLCPGPSLNQSSSAPNLVNLSSFNENTDRISGTAVTEIVSDNPSAVKPSHGHKRDKSLNLMDMSGSSIDLVDNFDVLSTQQSIINVKEPRVFDPFLSGKAELGPTSIPEPRKIPEPFLKPCDTTLGTPNPMASPMIPMRLGNSGTNSPAISRSNTPHASPSLSRKSTVNDPFSDLVINKKPAEFDQGKPIDLLVQQQSVGLGSQLQSNPSQQSTWGHSKPNYFSLSHAEGSVFGKEKQRQQQTTGLSDSTFSDLLSSVNFTSNQPPAKPATLQEQRRDELEKTVDPVKLKIMDWTRGKEHNIRALLSTLGDVLWDGEDRWPKPGMHVMVDAGQVKKMYRNASRVVHPDKQIGTDHEDLAKAIQTELNDAYSSFEEAELLR